MILRSRFRILAGIITLLVCQAAANAQAGDTQRGRALSETCLGCHGVDTLTNVYPTYKVPKLGGQYADYIAASLNGYKSKDRAHATMHSQAFDLTADEMRDIGAYFESLGADESTAKGTMPEAASTCTACHGDTGKGISSAFPSLNGQHADYLAAALSQYKSGERKNAIMAGFVGTLSDDDIEALANYYASQPGLSQPERDGGS
ncbi:MAG: c-type cytochrome [Pseudomonadota bacterium]